MPFAPTGYNQGAYIDLKNCEFFLEDGSGQTATVTAINAIGTSVLALTGASGEVVVGAIATIGTDTTVYTVTSVTNTSNVTTSVTISPSLVVATTAGEAITFSGNVLYVKIGEGNLTYDEKQPLDYKKDRGLLDQVRLGDQDPVDVKFDFAWIYLSSASGATTPTVEEAFKQIGNASSWVSTGQQCEPYAVNIVLINSPPCTSVASPVEKITLPYFRWTSLSHDAKTGMVAVTGTCNVNTVTRVRLTHVPGY